MKRTRRRVRARLAWAPVWDGKVQKWASYFIRKNQWRCDSVYEFDDLMQEAYLIYLRICDKYPKVIEPAHFLALFKRAMCNQIHDFSRVARKKRIVIQDTTKDVSELFVNRVGEITNPGYMNILLSEAPEELQIALALIEQNPKELYAKQPRRENLNQRLRRVLGIKDLDFIGEIQNLLQET